MREYRSQQLTKIRNSDDLTIVCGVPILPLATGSNTEGPCTVLRQAPDFKDIVTEAIELFRFIILLKNRFDIHTPADKVLVYLLLWVRRLLVVACSNISSIDSQQSLEKILIETAKDESLSVPGDENFSLSMFFLPPMNPKERSLCARYLAQLRIETARRLAGRIWETDRLSKWWTQYADINWMGLSVN